MCFRICILGEKTRRYDEKVRIGVRIYLDTRKVKRIVFDN